MRSSCRSSAPVPSACRFRPACESSRIPVPVGGVISGAPATVQVLDRIGTTNKFNGGVFGLRHEVRWGMWSLMTTGKIGVGNMHETINMYGVTSFANPSTNQVGASYGGLYANASNFGTYHNDEFVIIPELTVNLGINLTKAITLFAGYNFMWISQVARPANQINPVIDSSTVPFSPNFGQLGTHPRHVKPVQAGRVLAPGRELRDVDPLLIAPARIGGKLARPRRLSAGEFVSGGQRAKFDVQQPHGCRADLRKPSSRALSEWLRCSNSESRPDRCKRRRPTCSARPATRSPSRRAATTPPSTTRKSTARSSAPRRWPATFATARSTAG